MKRLLLLPGSIRESPNTNMDVNGDLAGMARVVVIRIGVKMDNKRLCTNIVMINSWSLNPFFPFGIKNLCALVDGGDSYFMKCRAFIRREGSCSSSLFFLHAVYDMNINHDLAMNLV